MFFRFCFGWVCVSLLFQVFLHEDSSEHGDDHLPISLHQRLFLVVFISSAEAKGVSNVELKYTRAKGTKQILQSLSVFCCVCLLFHCDLIVAETSGISLSR